MNIRNIRIRNFLRITDISNNFTECRKDIILFDVFFIFEVVLVIYVKNGTIHFTNRI